MYVLIYGLICFIATCIGAFSGIGGGVIIKPVFDMTFALSADLISFLSGATVLAMSFTSVLTSRKSPIKLDLKVSTMLAGGSVFGGILGKMLFNNITAGLESTNTMSAIQNLIIALLTILVGIYVYNKAKIKTYVVKNPFIIVIIGFILGGLGSFLGIGGGPINLTVLYFLFSMDSKTAALNSIYIILFGQASTLLVTVATNTVPVFSVLEIVFMAGFGILGAIVGRKIAVKISEKATERAFIVVLILITAISLVNVFRFI